MSRGARALVALALLGCASPAPPPPADGDRRAQLVALTREDTLDPWPHYELAQLDEEAGDVDAAIFEYGEAINRLPPRVYTGPVFRLALLHQRLGNVAAALRLFEEVLATVATDSRQYRENPSYRESALRVKRLLEVTDATTAREGLRPPGPPTAREGLRPPTAARLEALRERFLRDFGGTAAEWDAPPATDPPPGPQ